jgi:hypothetical protein
VDIAGHIVSLQVLESHADAWMSSSLAKRLYFALARVLAATLVARILQHLTFEIVLCIFGCEREVVAQGARVVVDRVTHGGEPIGAMASYVREAVLRAGDVGRARGEWLEGPARSHGHRLRAAWRIVDEGTVRSSICSLGEGNVELVSFACCEVVVYIFGRVMKNIVVLVARVNNQGGT